RLRVPHLHFSPYFGGPLIIAPASRGDTFAVWGERHASDREGVSLEIEVNLIALAEEVIVLPATHLRIARRAKDRLRLRHPAAFQLCLGLTQLDDVGRELELV